MVPDAALPADLAALLAARGAEVAAIEPIGGAGALRPRRATLRLRLRDGGSLKGRVLPSAADAARIAALVAVLDRATFPPVLAHRGACLLEPWVEGRPLEAGAGGGAPDPEALAFAGRTLAQLHATPSPLPCPAPDAVVAATRTACEGDLGRLVAAAALTPSEAAAAAHLLHRHAPDAAPAVIAHRDMAPENVVLSADGRLVVIDNAAIRLAAAEEDIARTVYRWPLTGSCERGLFAAYGDGAVLTRFAEHRPFWMTCVLVHAAWTRASRGYRDPEAPLRALRGVLAGR